MKKIREQDLDDLPEISPKIKIKKKLNKFNKSSRNDKRKKPQRGNRNKLMHLTF